MTTTEYQRAWDGWSAIRALELGKGTGRLAVFYEGRQYIFIDLSCGTIAAIDLSDRRLKIEYVLMRMGMISPDDIQQAFHRLEEIDRITPLSHILLDHGVITTHQLAAARRQQLTEVLQAIMVSKRDALMFVPGLVRVQKLEALIRIDDAAATAFATLGLSPRVVGRTKTSTGGGRKAVAAGDRRFAVVWDERKVPALTRQAR